MLVVLALGMRVLPAMLKRRVSTVKVTIPPILELVLLGSWKRKLLQLS